MTPHLKLRKPGSSALVTALILSIGAYSVAATARAADDVAAESSEFLPGADAGPMRPPATFFSINAVLAKIDRQNGRGPGALRLASLTPSNIATDAQPAPKEAPPAGTEPFGLFTFRAPEGMLWRKWRGVEAEIGILMGLDSLHHHGTFDPAIHHDLPHRLLAGATDNVHPELLVSLQF